MSQLSEDTMNKIRGFNTDYKNSLQKKLIIEIPLPDFGDISATSRTYVIIGRIISALDNNDDITIYIQNNSRVNMKKYESEMRQVEKFYHNLEDIINNNDYDQNYRDKINLHYNTILQKANSESSGIYRPDSGDPEWTKTLQAAAQYKSLTSSKSNIDRQIDQEARGASGLRSENLQSVNPEDLTPNSLEFKLNKQLTEFSITGLDLPKFPDLLARINTKYDTAQALISKIKSMGLESDELKNNWIKSIIRYIQFTVLQDVYNHFKDYYDNREYKDGIIDFITVFLQNNPLTVSDYRDLHPEISKTPKLTSWGKLNPNAVIYDNEIPRLFKMNINNIIRTNLTDLRGIQKRCLCAITVKITYDDSGNAIACPPNTRINTTNSTYKKGDFEPLLPEIPCNDNWAIPDQKFSPVKDKLIKENPEMTHLIGEYRSIQKHGDTFKKSVTLLGKNTRGFFGLGGRKTHRQRKHKVKGQKKTRKQRRKKTQKRRSKK